MLKKSNLLLVLTLMFVLILTMSTSLKAVELWHYWLSGGEEEALNAFLETAREMYPDTEFTDRGIPGASSELRRQLGSAFMAGDPPETFQATPGYGLKIYVEAGRLKNIDEVWNEINGDEIFSDGLKDVVKFNGHAYAIPLNTHIISHIFYNKQIFDEYNIEPPTNWEEFKDISEILRENNIEPFAAAGGSWALYHFYSPLITVLSPEGYMELARGEVAFTDPKVKEAFELYGDAFVSSYMFGWSGYGWSEAANEVINGNAAMYLNGDWVVAYFEQAGFEPGVDFGFFPAPGTQDSMVMQVDSLAATRESEDQDGLNKILKVAGSIKGQAAFNAKKGSVAANLNVEPDIYNPILKETYDRIQRMSEEGTMLPNLSFILPRSLYEEMARQVEIYALNPNEATLNNVLETLEAKRQDLLEEDAFLK